METNMGDLQKEAPVLGQLSAHLSELQLNGQNLTRWEIDAAHSSVLFSIRHMMISNVRGEFTRVTGFVDYDSEDPALSVAEATIDPASINTRDPKRDDHLRSPDFFDVQQFPLITFRSTSIEEFGKREYVVTGELIMHGLARTVTLDVVTSGDEIVDPLGVKRRAVSGTTVLNRKDFGLKWNKALEAGGFLVGDEVSVTIDIEFVQKADKSEETRAPQA